MPDIEPLVRFCKGEIMSEACSISIHDQPNPNDVCAIEDGLRKFNLQYAPPDNHRPLVAVLRSDDDRLLGGLIGITFWGWLHVDILWIDETLRHQGRGRRLLQSAEEEAVRRGCHHAFLDTLSFQALPFYQQPGYAIFGEQQDIPLGHSRYYLQKVLLTVSESQSD